jgi:Lactate racemase N-terminal domain
MYVLASFALIELTIGGSFMSLHAYQDRSQLLHAVPLPPMMLLRQRFQRPLLADVASAVADALATDELTAKITPGARIAIAVGSRGVANIALITRALVATFRRYGADPFVVPAMGSHGGATAEGQRSVLESLGVTEAYIEAPIISSLDVDQLGTLPNGLPVYLDHVANTADGIFVVNRVKPHTDFSAPIESGLSKMLAIGLGKHKGAITVHSWGLDGLTVQLPEVAKYTIAHSKILGGLAVVENAYDEVAELAFVSPEGIGNEHERVLLERAKSLMPRLPWDTLDVLVIDEMGKDISGAGMDPNIIGRMRWGDQKATAAEITSIAVLDLTEPSHGNAIGLGFADFTTTRLFEKIDSESLYINTLTAGVIALNSGKVPMVLRTDREAISAAIRTCGRPNMADVCLARIKNTLSLEYILASATSLDQLRPSSDVELIGTLQPFGLNGDGSAIFFEQNIISLS